LAQHLPDQPAAGPACTCAGRLGHSERRHPQHAALDPAGQLLSIVALGALCYGLIAIGEHGLLAPVTLLALGIAAAGWRCSHRRAPRGAAAAAAGPVGDRRFGMLNLASFVLGFTAYASLFFLSLFFQQAQGHGAALAGSQLVPQFLLMGWCRCCSAVWWPARAARRAGAGLHPDRRGAVRDGHVRTGYFARHASAC
jgi:hypothetical protein